MTVFPKRVWTKKWMVFNDKKPVRKLGDKVWVYDPNFKEVNSWKVYPEKDRENVSSSDELMYYDWLQPTEFGTFEDGFEATYTVTIEVSPEWAGSVDTSEVTVADETPIEVEGRVLTIGENIEVIATAEKWYKFSSWWELPETVTEDLTITATFKTVA